MKGVPVTGPAVTAVPATAPPPGGVDTGSAPTGVLDMAVLFLELTQARGKRRDARRLPPGNGRDLLAIGVGINHKMKSVMTRNLPPASNWPALSWFERRLLLESSAANSLLADACILKPCNTHRASPDNNFSQSCANGGASGPPQRAACSLQ